MKTYQQHSAAEIREGNIPGRAMRAIFYAAARVDRPPTAMEITAAGLEARCFVSNLSAAISQIREILQREDIGDIVTCPLRGRREVGYRFDVWHRERFDALLRRLMLPWRREICLDKPRPNYETNGQMRIFA